ncbi:MAG: glycine betaine ABC transporter substrate-binding protein, partial [Desulfovibrionales bacterium]
MLYGLRFILVCLLSLMMSLACIGCGEEQQVAEQPEAGQETTPPAKENPIVVGGKNFTEQYILAELAGLLLEEEGFDVSLKTGVGTNIARQSLENGQIDLYYEYTGTAYTVFYEQGEQEVMSDPEQVYNWVKEADDEKGLVWLEPVNFNNTYTLMMRKDHADELNITSITDLSRYVGENPGDLIVGVGAEFWERPDGYKALAEIYELNAAPEDIKKMSLGLTYKALLEEEVDVAMGFATDGRIAAFGLVNLEDNRDFFAVYNPAPVARQDALEKYPEIRD